MIKTNIHLEAEQDKRLAALGSYRQSCRNAAHRGLVVLSGEQEWSLDFAGKLVDPDDRILWITNNKTVSSPVITADRAIDWLGRELDVVVFDAHSGLNPDALGAITGAIAGGGLLILLTPPLRAWPSCHDPEYRKILQYPFQAKDAIPGFITRLAGLIEQSSDCARINQEGGWTVPERLAPDTEKVDLHNTGLFRSQDQAQAVEAICRVSTGHRRRPLMLLSDRGRGKSSSLGIAAAQLLKQGIRKILVTAPRLNAVTPLFERVQALLPEAEITNGHLVYKDCEITFVPPDELLQQLPDTELLLVDEAAAIPIPMLEKILQRYARVVFSSTVHGYEGTGRGFGLKFTQTLNRLASGWKQVTLETPIRWADHDPLEYFIFRALLLDATIPAPDLIGEFQTDELMVEKLEHERLHDETLLQKVFGMLVMAHYRTRPMDLRRLLDAPDVDVFIARIREHVVGVVMCVHEGGLNEESIHGVFEGNRRVQGHLIPQSLLSHSGIQGAMATSIARVMRIAVHPSLQRQGIGKQLLASVVDYYRGAGLDALGVSFGATDEVIAFWKSCGFRLCRIGFRREASSGTHSFIMMQALNETGHALQNKCESRFLEELPLQLSEALRDLDVSLLGPALSPSISIPEILTEQDRQVLMAFTESNRGYEESLVAIWKQMLLALHLPQSLMALEPVDRQVLLAKVLQKISWEDAVAISACRGKAELLVHMRKAVQLLYELCLRTGEQ